MLRFALIGRDISHSRSEKTYRQIIAKDFMYDLLDYPDLKLIPSFKSLLLIYKGISVTSPYKEYAFLNTHPISLVKDIGFVNCIKLKDDLVVSTNTDYLAIKKILENIYIKKINLVAILGDGAMASVLKYILRDLQIGHKQFSRANNNLRDSERLDSSKLLVINCCSREFNLAMLNYPSAYVWDLNYESFYTDHLNQKLGFRFESGDRLLHEQAKFAVDFWNDV